MKDNILEEGMLSLFIMYVSATFEPEARATPRENIMQDAKTRSKNKTPPQKWRRKTQSKLASLDERLSVGCRCVGTSYEEDECYDGNHVRDHGDQVR